MNLNDNPTLEQLRALLLKGDDLAGHHVLWVKKDGTVVLTQLERTPRSKIPPFDHPDMQMRCGTFPVAYEYVGPEAAADDWWTPLLFTSMVENWAKAKGTAGVWLIGLDSVAPDGRPVDAEERAWIKQARENHRARKAAEKSRLLPYSYE